MLSWWREGGAEPAAAGNDAATVDRIVVRKSVRRMDLLAGARVVRSYSVALGFAPAGPKEREGDGRTPEGIYRIAGRNPQSLYHLSLRISYPGPEDVAAAAARGEDPGGDIMIHGWPNAVRDSGHPIPQGDWTLGCVAVSNAEIEEIWRLVADGTAVEIRP